VNAALGWLLVTVALVVAPFEVVARKRRDVRVPRWFWSRRVASTDASLPLVLDLAAAALRSGRPVADALALAAPAGHPDVVDVVDRVARLLRLGADPTHAWSAVPRDGPLAQVARVAVRSAASGVKLAAAFERLAAQLRDERAAVAAQRANRAAVVAMGPLAACFLPSFIFLGIVPVVVGVAGTALHTVP
jgi:Flp pilus assembly protein TadB